MSSGVATAPSRAEVLEAAASSLAEIGDLCDLLPIGDELAVLNHIRAHCDARESQRLAARLDSGVSSRAVEALLQKGDKTSKRSAKTRTRRARAVSENPGIAQKMQAGVLSADQADVIATAADKTGGAAARDAALIDTVAATPPDQAKRLADEWVREHTTASQVQERYDRQRRLRNVRRWVSDRGTDILALEGDTESIDRIEHAIANYSAELYRVDGGRDLPSTRHPRTRDQRNFDAAHQLLTQTTDPKLDGTKRSGSRPAPRSTIVVTMTRDQALGIDPTPVRSAGGGLLAPSLLEQLFCEADLIGVVTDGSGMPLWMGRSNRFFTHAQWLALIARDGGCVQCGAHYSLCEAHHIIPWEAPARGPTDIDNGALVCTDCHHQLHDHDRIRVRNPDSGTWSTRPAQPHEIAPKRKPAEPEPEHPDSQTRQNRPRTRTRNRNRDTRPRLHERRRTGALW